MLGFRSALAELDFTEVATPKIVGTATESGANLFSVDYFGERAYLAQSPQLYKQILVGVFERVFEVGPVFRAEPHDTVRHLAQYTSLDAELGFIRDHRDVLAVLRAALAGMVESIRSYAAEAASLLGLDLPQVPEEFPVIHFRDALARVGADPDEPDLSPAHERALSSWAWDEYGSDFLAVEGYPMAKRPFYTHPWRSVPPARPKDAYSAESEGEAVHSNSFDLLFRGLELCTGGQRLHRSEDYAAALARTGTDPALLEGYLEAFAHGMPPHGGFAIGLERWVGRLTGAENIREVTLFPRDLHRLFP
jgi:nondiscriminating aspartyl-tRNA synthetase